MAVSECPACGQKVATSWEEELCRSCRSELERLAEHALPPGAPGAWIREAVAAMLGEPL